MPRDNMPTIRVVPDADALTAAAEAFVTDAVLGAIERHGRCSIALAGGSTPRALYARLQANDADRLPWQLIDIWFGDERCVPPDDEASNYGMAMKALLRHVPLPAANVRRIEGELGAARAADEYDTLLREAFGATAPPTSPASDDPVVPTDSAVPNGSPVPTFDLVLLGIGAEGHTASLFPGHSALGVTDRWAVAVDPAPETAVPPVPRVTLTLPALHGAEQILVLALGAEKRPIVEQVRAGDETLPAAQVRGRERTMWIVDAAAG